MLDKIAENFQEIHQSLIDNFYRYEQKEKINSFKSELREKTILKDKNLDRD